MFDLFALDHGRAERSESLKPSGLVHAGAGFLQGLLCNLMH